MRWSGCLRTPLLLNSLKSLYHHLEMLGWTKSTNNFYGEFRNPIARDHKAPARVCNWKSFSVAGFSVDSLFYLFEHPYSNSVVGI